MGRMWTPAEVCELVKRYPAEGAAGLATRLGRSADSISSQANRYGIRSKSRRLPQGRSKAIRSRTVNVRFFDEISPTVAYVLGFTWACGGVKTRHRHVLQLSCDRERRDRLTRVLSLMGSRHQIQDQYGNIAIVEICNSHLVKQLLQNFGQPSGRENPDPSLPDMPVAFVPHFARGHLDAAGHETPSVVGWTGTPRVITNLREYMQEAVNAGPTTCYHAYGKVSIAWAGEERVQRIHEFLENLQNL